MPESLYKIIELVGASEKGWQDAVEKCVSDASKTLRDLRIAEVVQLDVKIDNQKIVLWRARVRLSFKYEGK
ncbi:MAG: dodecin family protein [Candidatus Helarchaeota archaeon]